MTVSRRWLLVGGCALVFAASAVGLALSVTSPDRPPPGKPDLSVDIVVVPEVMTAVYKDYSGQTGNFLAKTIIKNAGADPVTNFQIRYSIPGYVTASSQEDYPVILPGQTVNDYCYPKFDAKQMKAITSETQAELDVDYSCDSGGTHGTSKDFSLLGHNDWVRTYLPEEDRLTFADQHDNAAMLAAFVTKDDPMVNRLAKRFTRGIYTGDDDGAWDAATAIWNKLYAWGCDYVTESSAYWTQDAQEVQFPAETLANGGGNCVDLSLLLSAMLEAVGVKTYLYLVTGHCQVGVMMPESGDIYVIEETLVGDPDATLTDAINTGYDLNQKEREQDTWVRIDVQNEWANGMVPSW